MLSDGCLKMTSWSARNGRAKAKGLELQPLFEHGLVLTLRGSDGSAISEKPLTATEGVFKPDFSGYSSPGQLERVDAGAGGVARGAGDAGGVVVVGEGRVARVPRPDPGARGAVAVAR